MKRLPITGEPYHDRIQRCHEICNCTVVSPLAFVIHDIIDDESFHLCKSAADTGFYAGAPIRIRGLAVVSLCMLNVVANIYVCGRRERST